MVAARVRQARARQAARTPGLCNAQAPLDRLVAQAEQAALDLMEKAVDRLGLSNRGYTRSLRVARTIADLAEEATIRREHVAEALSYRQRSLSTPASALREAVQR